MCLGAKITLGHLIFGRDSWLSLSGELAHNDDPLTALYRRYVYRMLLEYL
jgi:hypothetical protein